MSICIDVEGASGKVGDGPIVTAEQWEARHLLDACGEFHFRMPATDPRAALLAPLRLARCYTASPDGPREVGAGIIMRISRDVSGDVPMLDVSGPDMLRELAYRSVGFLAVREQRWTDLKGRGAVRYIRSDGTPGDWDRPEAYDNNENTHTADIVCDSQEWLYVGCDARFDRMRFRFRAGHTNTDPCVTQWQYFNEQAGWKICRNAVDGTATGGVPFNRDGDITLDMPADWNRCTPTGAAGSWFWLRCRCVSQDTTPFQLRELYVYSDFPTTNGLQQIMAYAPPGWALDTINGYDTTAKEAYLQFAGESVLEALRTLGEATGEHFRLGGGRQLAWLRQDMPLSPIRGIQATGDAVAQESNDDVALITRLTETEDAYEMYSRVYPWGAGLGGGRVTLAKTTRTAPAGYTLDKDANYIRYDALELAGTRIERHVQFPDILKQQSDSWAEHPKFAANALFDAALNWLQQRVAEAHHYALDVAKLRAPAQPGSCMHVVYQQWVDGYRAFDINTYPSSPLYVLGVRESIGQDGSYLVGLELGSVPRQPDSDASTIVGAMEQLSGVVRHGSSGSSTIVLESEGGDAADTVDGYHASKTPQPSCLLALDADAKFPASTITLAPTSGLDLSGGLALADTVAGAGLSIASKMLAVGAGHGIQVEADAVSVVAGTGIVVDPGGVAIDLAADLLWTGQHLFHGAFIARSIQPELPDAYDLGTSTKPWRKGYFSELEALVFAEETVQLVGGWLVVPHDQGTLAANVTTEATTVDFGKAMTVGDFICLRSSAPAVEYMQVGSLVSGTVYNVMRDLEETEAQAWPAGTAFLVMGAAGEGRLELNASDTPRIQLLTQGATYDAQTEVARLGDLDGNWGYAAPAYGLAVGEYAAGKANLTLDQVNGLRLRTHSATIIQLDNAGNASIEGTLAMGTAGVIDIDSGNVVINSTGLLVGSDASEGLRFASATPGAYSSIYDNSNLLGASKGGLGLFSSSQYWGIEESGGAKLAMDAGAGGFWKFQPREGYNAVIGIGPASDNYVMLEASSQPLLNVHLGFGATPDVAFRLANMHYSAASLGARVVIINTTVPAGSYQTMAANLMHAFVAVAFYDRITGGRSGHVIADMTRGASDVVWYGTTSTTALWTTSSASARVRLTATGNLDVGYTGANPARVIGLAIVF